MNIVMIVRLLSLFSLIVTTMDLRAQPAFEELREKLDHVKIMDGPYLGGSLQDKKFINSSVQNSWREITREIDRFTTKEQQKIIAAAMDNLDDPTYLEFCITFLGLLKNQKIDIISGKYIIMPNESKQGFLAVNYKNHNLSSALSEVRDLFGHEPPYLQFIDSILSGQANDEFLKFTEGTGLKARLPVDNSSVISVPKVITDKKVSESFSNKQLEIPNKPSGKSTGTNFSDYNHTNFSSSVFCVLILLATLVIIVWFKARKPKSTS